jgi:copper chaperone NosL
MKRLAQLLFYGALLLVLLVGGGCAKKQEAVKPLEMTRSTACALDGMLLLDYPGPKAQIHYADGKHDFFCDTVEMFSIYLRPETQTQVVGIFTQDMGKADWKTPVGNWIDAKGAYYVRGSKVRGAMGPTLASFARKEDADAFVQKNGGNVLRFDQVTIDMVDLHGGASRDEGM